MEGCRRLADLLAVAAGKLLAHMLDHLPLPRDHLQRLGDILAQLAQPSAAATLAGCRSGFDHPLARQMFGERLARRSLANEACRRAAPPRWRPSRRPVTAIRIDPAPAASNTATCRSRHAR